MNDRHYKASLLGELGAALAAGRAPDVPFWVGKHNQARSLRFKARKDKRKAARSPKHAKRLARRKRVRAQ